LLQHFEGINFDANLIEFVNGLVAPPLFYPEHLNALHVDIVWK
jgi:hypothetical protein